jgi:hypothetical protein
MNMISSLKAMLFTSAATALPGEGQIIAALPGEGGADFAQLLSGTMEASAEAAPLPTAMPEATDALVVDQTAPVEQADPTAILPLTLATALQTVQGQGGDALPLPLGPADMSETEAALEQSPIEQPPIKQALIKEPGPSKTHQAAVQAATGETLPASPEAEGDADASGAEAVADPVEHPAPETPIAVAQAPVVAVVALSTPLPLSAPIAETPSANAVEEIAESAPQPIRAQVSPNLGEGDIGAVTHAPALAAPLAQAAPAMQPDTVQPKPALQERGALAEQVQAAVVAPSIAGAEQVAVEQAPVEQAPVRQAQAAVTDSAVAPDPAAPQAVTTARPQLAKSEALALLQMVRDQMEVRQPATPPRASEQAMATPRAKAERPTAQTEAAPTPLPQPMPGDVSPPLATVAATPVVAQSSVAPQPVADLSASLGAQVVDMGVSGQWIDNLARDIAGLSANGAQGRFQINSDRLGAVQVDIRQGDHGAAVSLTVASEAAEMALRQDSDRLKLDAGLAAIRIAEVKIERAPHVAEASRAEGANSQNQQQSSQQQGQQQPAHPSGQGAWANSQNMGQSAQQQGRWRGAENSAFSSKNSGDPAVLNHDEMRRAGNDAVRARYA